MAQGRQVEVDQDEAPLERVAAVDVAKATGMVCTRTPHPTKPGKRVTTVWEVSATTNAITELAEQLTDQGIQRVVLESTADYWRAFFYLLEAAGLRVWLVNARQVKNVPGRPKTDKLDAVWLAKLNERGMLTASLVPPAPIRMLRDYTRLRVDLTAERSRHIQRLEKLLEDALIKLSVVAADIMGVSGRAMLEALIAGERDPKVLAELARGRMRPKRAALSEALTGRFDDHHAELARVLLDAIDNLTGQITQLSARIQALINAIPAAQAPTPPPQAPDRPPAPPPLPAVDRLDEVTGIGPLAAQGIIAELGLDMQVFPSAGHLVSWAKLSPQTLQSGATHRTRPTGNGNRYLRRLLGEAAAAAGRTDTFLGERYRRLARRRGKLKALVATARSILVIVWHLLADPTARYRDLGADYHTTRIDRDRKTRHLVGQLQALGHQVTLTPSTAAIPA